MEFSKRKLYFIPLLYGIIVFLANVAGNIIPNFFNVTEMVSYDVNEWMRFLNENSFTTPIQYITFAVPIIWCICYIRFTGKKFESHYINLPVAYSAIGTSGWFIYLLLELILFVIAGNMGYNINYKTVFISSFMNIFLEAIVTFTLSYFIISTIHKRFILPELYPDGKISKIKGIWQPSIKFLFVINYISVTLFPILLLVFYYDSNAESKNRSLLVLASVMLIGLIITFGITMTFEKPLKQIKKRIEKIKEGDYSTHITVASNDDFGELSDTMNEMTDSIEQKTQKIIEIQNSIITGMATMVESRDNSTGGHIKRTSDCVRVFVQYLQTLPAYENISEKFFENVIKAAPMHDLGKIAVPDAILQKPGKFTDEEYEMMKSHSKEGARIVNEVLSATEDEDFKKIAINVAHYHHEKWNGSGYPKKIAAEQIPLEARIMALADVFDALVSKRCYKDSFSYDKAFEIIQNDLGTHFDPQLGAEFIKCRASLEKLYESYL